MITILGISGSLRRDSYNTAALRMAQELAPEGVHIDIADISGIPLYDDDVRLNGNPEAVQRFRAQVAAADAILFATPEYNFSVSGVLKNAIDWASRPPDQPFQGKPVAIMGAATGIMGTTRAQYHLRQILVFLDAHPINKPEVMISKAAEKFDGAGRLIDEVSCGLVKDLITALAAWTIKLKK